MCFYFELRLVLSTTTHPFTVDTSLVLNLCSTLTIRKKANVKINFKKLCVSTLELYVHTHEVVRDRYCGEQYAQAMNINMNNVITFIWGHILPLLCCVQQLIGPGGNTPSHTHAHTHTHGCLVVWPQPHKPWIYVQKGNTGAFYECSLSIHASFFSFLSIC